MNENDSTSAGGSSSNSIFDYNELPTCLRYHPESELASQPGYYPNISPDQLKAASKLRYMIRKDGLDFNCDEEDEFLKLLRFLRARKFHAQHTFDFIKSDVKWRSEENRLNLRKELAEEVLNCDVGAMYDYFPTWIQGTDKQLRPVSYRQFGKFEIWNVLKLTTMDRLLRFHAWETEVALRSMYALSKKSGYNIETFVLVIDAAGWSMKLATSDAFTFIKGMANTDSDHYPERLGTMIVINAPGVLSFAWKITQSFLDPVTKSKIRILPAVPTQWKPVLLEYIDEDQIPQQYGGTAPDPTRDDAIRMMDPKRLTDQSTNFNETDVSVSSFDGDREDILISTGTATGGIGSDVAGLDATAHIVPRRLDYAEDGSLRDTCNHPTSYKTVGTQTLDEHSLNMLLATNELNTQKNAQCHCTVM